MSDTPRDPAVEELLRLAGGGKKRRTPRSKAPGVKAARAPRPPKAPRAKKPKPPCKYGPRDARGYCPKKPRAARDAVVVRDLQSARAAGAQAVRVLRSSKATSEQKREALATAGSALAWESGKSGARAVTRELRKAGRSRAGREALRKVKSVVGGAVVAGGKKVAVLAAGGYVIKKAAQGIEAAKRRDARKWAQAELARTEKKTGRLPADQRAALLRQYEEWRYRQPVYTPTIK